MRFKLPIIPEDTANHFIYGIVIYFITNLVFGVFIAVMIGIIAGISKEIYDELHKNHVSDWKDAAVTMAGVLLGVLLTIL